MPEPAAPHPKKGELFGLPTWAAVLAIGIGVILVFRLLRSSPAQATAGPQPLSTDQAAANAGAPSTNTAPLDMLSAEVTGVLGLLSQELATRAQEQQAAQVTKCNSAADCPAGCKCKHGVCVGNHGAPCSTSGNAQSAAAHAVAA